MANHGTRFTPFNLEDKRLSLMVSFEDLDRFRRLPHPDENNFVVVTDLDTGRRYRGVPRGVRRGLLLRRGRG